MKLGCLRCGSQWRKVVGQKLVCQKCGHIDEVKMNDADTIELAETEVARLIEVCHRQGLSYWQILRLFLLACHNLYIQTDAEYWLKGGK